ncbi:MAG: hypothetical protein K6G03_08000 [Lachnospiraceae bacterium]|nr:hypothetical protein [Lachnospiraceae bacterium]
MKKNVIKILIVILLLGLGYAGFCFMSTSISAPFIQGNEMPATTIRKELSGTPVPLLELAVAAAPCLDTPIKPVDSTGYILIGDSRTVGIDNLLRINLKPDGFFIVAASGQGFEYMMNTALPAAMEIEKAYPEIKEWRYIINMGVNDLSNKDIYKDALTDLAYKKNLYIVSVNPVEYSPVLEKLGMTNDYIEKFNDTMKTVPNSKYIDVYSYLMDTGYSTEEGLHYDWDTTKKIFSKIRESVESDKTG